MEQCQRMKKNQSSPLPTFPKGLTAMQKECLANMRAACREMVRQAYPRSTDSGKTEVQIAMGVLDSIYERVSAQADAIYNAITTNQKTGTGVGLSDFISNEIYKGLDKLQAADLKMLLASKLTGEMITDRGYLGLPHSEKEMESIIRLPDV
jgi:hypothetical protein